MRKRNVSSDIYPNEDTWDKNDDGWGIFKNLDEAGLTVWGRRSETKSIQKGEASSSSGERSFSRRKKITKCQS